jgi:anti-sigma B factor antagonist
VERSSGAAPPRQPGGSTEGETDNGQLLTVRVESAGPNASVVSLAGELDLSTIPRIEGRLFEQLRSHPGVVVDLTRLSFIDSSGIGLLIKAFRALDEGGRLHTVIAPGSQVERVFRLAGIDRALPLFAEQTRALDSLNGDAGD